MQRTSREKLLLVEERDASKRKKLQSHHAGLWLDKYIYNPQQDAIDQTKRSIRQQLLEEVAAIGISDVYKKHYARWQQQLQMFGAEPKYAKAKGRISVGLGTENVLEAGITLHHTYGVPYLPGSALKGLAASYAHQQLEDERWRIGAPWHKIVFGTSEEAGFITFFDALLDPEQTTTPFLHQDIITVHHPEYYQTGKKPPADWDNPTPISFLSANGTYLLALAAPDLDDEKEVWLQATWEILKLALADVGIGAKTSSGYGRMGLDLDEHNSDQPAEMPEQIAISTLVIDPEESTTKNILMSIKVLRHDQVANQSEGIYKDWKKLQKSENRVQVAQALFEKVQAAGRAKKSADRYWYKEMQDFLQTESTLQQE